VSDEQPKKKRGTIANLRPWKPGQSGNPGGKPNVAREIAEQARAAAPGAFERLVYLVKHGSGAVQVQAAKAVLGIAGVTMQPSTSVKHTHELIDSRPQLSVAELIALVREPAALPPAHSVTETVTGPMAPSVAGPGKPPDAPQAGRVEAIPVEFQEVSSPIERTKEETQSSRSGAEPDGQEV